MESYNILHVPWSSDGSAVDSEPGALMVAQALVRDIHMHRYANCVVYVYIFSQCDLNGSVNFDQ